ncbi:succinyldiaminopimelate transaminase [Salicola sp. Rm-C-2C1-2]|uniref:succinyldiaminopimelate transaminase n=1 Tax=Salicola sp. Rm-C-2C1-2 TaxID=3141321 RepID=UPI0032E369EE
MNPRLDELHPYPFQKLAQLFEGTEAPEQSPIALSIGEPKHPAPGAVLDTLGASLQDIARYPGTQGLPELREAIAGWATRRFNLAGGGLNPATQILPLNGTREGLFSFAQAMLSGAADSLVVTPNPFYQIYEGAALLAGAQPYFVNSTRDGGGLPDFSAVPAGVWDRCELVYLCSPGNPNGAVMGLGDYRHLLELADRHNFLIAADECYSEIHHPEAEPPLGMLEACHRLGRDDYRRCVVFHSLSKRSNLPGLRSGFAAGDAACLARFLRYRTYHGCAMPVHHQRASITAWQDEAHVDDNRMLYQQKFDTVLPILEPWLDVTRPQAGFYLWPRTPMDDETFARALYNEENVTVLPGRYLSRTSDGVNPGENRVRMALVASVHECVEAAQRIARFIERRTQNGSS